MAGCLIDAYQFGQMVVAGKRYTGDLIILPEGEVFSPWWREDGHRLVVEDLEPVLNAQVSSLVVGTGASGMMKVDPALSDYLEGRGITVVVLKTSEAVDRFNQLSRESEGVAGCFHLTC